MCNEIHHSIAWNKKPKCPYVEQCIKMYHFLNGKQQNEVIICINLQSGPFPIFNMN